MMKRFSTWVARRLAPGCDNQFNIEACSRVGLLEGWVSIVVNTLMAAAKWGLGYFTGSISLIVDATHTFADSGTSAIVIYGFRAARRPADKEHPYGHGRADSIAGVVIAVLLGVTAIEMGRAALGRILHPQQVEAANWVIALVVLMMIGKELLARFSSELGHLINSDALQADAWHHRSDVFATGLVVVAFIASRYGLSWVDGIAGLGVAVLIAWAAVEILKHSSAPLMGQNAPESMYGEIADVARSVEGVLDIHEMRVERYGLQNVISLHVVVVNEISFEKAHEVTRRVESVILERFPGSATVHADPVARFHPHWAKVRRVVEGVVRELEYCSSYHDLCVTGPDTCPTVRVDVATDVDLSDEQAQNTRQIIKNRILDELSDVSLEVYFDPPYLKH
ncbi:MAG: cation transporter [Deltaproteobacteria bacterium]|nr:MAG: cation transporter [Deltaproteobacteria bacterium]